MTAPVAPVAPAAPAAGGCRRLTDFRLASGLYGSVALSSAEGMSWLRVGAISLLSLGFSTEVQIK